VRKRQKGWDKTVGLAPHSALHAPIRRRSPPGGGRPSLLHSQAQRSTSLCTHSTSHAQLAPSSPHGQIEAPYSSGVLALPTSSAPRGCPPPSTWPGSRCPHRRAPPRLLHLGVPWRSEADRSRSSLHGSVRLPPTSRRSHSWVNARHHEFAAHQDGWQKVVHKSKRKRKRFDLERVSLRRAASSSSQKVLLDLVGLCFNYFAEDHIACRCPNPVMLLPMSGARTSGQG
jgi:hypothetical protein